MFWNFFQCQNKFDYWLLIYWIRSWITITLGPGIFIGWMVNNFHGLASVVIRDPYWYFFFKSSSMTDDILALAKFYLPNQYERMATEWHVNGKFTSTLLLFSILDALSLSKQFIWLCHMFAWMQKQHRASAVDKLKIELSVIVRGEIHMYHIIQDGRLKWWFYLNGKL